MGCVREEALKKLLADTEAKAKKAAGTFVLLAYGCPTSSPVLTLCMTLPEDAKKAADDCMLVHRAVLYDSIRPARRMLVGFPAEKARKLAEEQKELARAAEKARDAAKAAEAELRVVAGYAVRDATTAIRVCYGMSGTWSCTELVYGATGRVEGGRSSGAEGQLRYQPTRALRDARRVMLFGTKTGCKAGSSPIVTWAQMLCDGR
eukprot:602978-Rhodomonas_salina.1